MRSVWKNNTPKLKTYKGASKLKSNISDKRLLYIIKHLPVGQNNTVLRSPNQSKTLLVNVAWASADDEYSILSAKHKSGSMSSKRTANDLQPKS